MNKYRRNRLQKIYEAISAIQADLEEVRDEEQEAFDNMPEDLQYSERGEAIENALSELEDALYSMEEMLEHIESASE
mgnify:CR=1 FL=1